MARDHKQAKLLTSKVSRLSPAGLVAVGKVEAVTSPFLELWSSLRCRLRSNKLWVSSALRWGNALRNSLSLAESSTSGACGVHADEATSQQQRSEASQQKSENTCWNCEIHQLLANPTHNSKRIPMHAVGGG